MELAEGRTLTGPAGTATEVLLEGSLPVADWSATVATWFLICPGQSPAWDRYLLSIIHLRDIDGVPSAVVTVPGATHEVMLFALNPDANPSGMDIESWQRLTPHNVSEQVELPNDAAACVLAEECANAVVKGVLPAEPPLSGQREPWRTVLIKTSAHHRGEEHAS